ncbi:MAG: hypothetical protein KAI61_02445 [Alphaproteobacteria bacterium]|nr:hypothetical protein [Alphaproteobacteria bacterium]
MSARLMMEIKSQKIHNDGWTVYQMPAKGGHDVDAKLTKIVKIYQKI